MKKLTRMLLIHWHNYEKEVIDFDMINFLTGKTAAGKSTIIDALQLVLLGDTNGSFFNKAANQKSARTLKSYLFGEMGDDGDTGFRYLRNDRFTSYVALEFEDTERKSRFTAGFISDCYKDQSIDFKWFILHSQGFPENLFVDESTRTPFDIQGLKTFLSRTLGKKKSTLYEFYDTNKRYQDVTLAKFGQIKNKYRVLLKKAVPFSPIADIEQFITESICDVKNNIQVDQMQSDIRQYKSLEEDAKRTKERIGRLREISGINREYEKEKEKYLQQKYIVVRAEKEQFAEQEKKYREEITEKQALISEHREQMKSLEEERKRLKKELESLEKEYSSSSLVQREKELKLHLNNLAEEIERLEAGVKNACQQIRKYGRDWAIQIKNVEETGFSLEPEFFELAESMSALEENQASDFPYEPTADTMRRMQQQVSDYRAQLKGRAEQLQRDIKALEATVENLERGIKPFPGYVTALKRLLEETLFSRHKKTVNVYILADLLEVRDPAWRNAIEGYLDKQKFYLMVPEEYYKEALRIYNQEKREKEIYDAGLVDIGKLRKNFGKKPMAGSLAEEIETEHPDARLYADYLLGGVVKCDDVDELNQHKISITRSCMLYKGYVSRKLNPSRYASPFIGRRSMELLLRQNREELQRQKKLYEETAGFHRVVRAAAETPILGEYEAKQHRKAVEDGRGLDGLREQRGRVQEEYDGLDLLYLERMKDKIKALKTEVETNNNHWHDLDKKNGRLDVELTSLRGEKLPEAVRQVMEIQQRIEQEFDHTWIAETGEPRFREVQGGKFEVSLRERFFAAMRQTEIKRDNLRKNRTEKRSRYNADYKMPYDVEEESNRFFDKELNELEQIRLPEYVEKIRDSREKAYNQFRDDFIAKIKSNIESVTQQIEELNASLKQSVFGTDRYRFVKKPRPEYQNYYNMIMDPLLMDTGGWNIASQSFNEKYQKEIDELFQLLILNETNVTAERRAEYEKSIRKFTDYKTYLVFDLIVTDEQGEEQRLSKTLLKKSGGETQIPFYIALLASFSQVCRIRNKNQNNTIRVIILDEAFSKMDGERIRESIHLLRRFGLQAIFSAPPDKIPDIAPLVDRNIAVYKDNRHSFTRRFDPKEIEEDFEET
ncbi:ATP-binding protein [Clostridium transplantifaecale]|uniref:ATP-binding protein n=1 Tax=Clostridium transplantifaecale TaxID=2479838 RepID=UPI000F62CA6E|nr:SbcC/MukB-like Walker B domain-containing protein [Clostridium transplantifaecale]